MKEKMFNLKNFGEKLSLIDDAGNRLSYSQLSLKNIELISHIGSGCLVFSLCSNTIGSVIGYTAFINNEIVPLLLNKNLDSDLLCKLIDQYKPSFLWIPGDLESKFNSYKKVYSDYDYTLLKTNFNKKYMLNDKLALLLATSGSTGSPKLVRQSLQNIISNTNAIIKFLSIDSKERAITTLPMNYTYGLSIINTHLYSGATLLLTEKSFMEKEFWNLMKEEKATSFGGVPYTYEILDKLRFYKMDLPYLKTMTQAGGRLSIGLQKKITEYAINNDKRFFVMYGQTEATARMAYLPYKKSLEKHGSIGKVIPGGKFIIVDGEVEITKPNVTGELVYYGNNVTLGYAVCGEDLAKGDENNGRLVTGDMAKMDEDGFYYITGRKKRFLKIFGSRVNLDEIESIIKNEFDNIDCACGGEDDLLKIFITDNIFENKIVSFVSKKTGINSSAFVIKCMDSIPKNDAGKILYNKL